MELGSRLKALMDVRKMTQSDLFRESGISRSHISEILSGKRPSVTSDTLNKLAKTLRVAPSYFLEKEEPIPLLSYAEHFPEDIQKFLMAEENLAYITVIKEFADKKIPPEDLKEIVALILKHKENNVK